MVNLIDNDLEKRLSGEPDRESDNDESKEWFVKSYKKYFNNNKMQIAYINHASLGFFISISPFS